MNNIYSSDHYKNVKNDELLRGTKMYNKAQNPMETGIVPRPAYASMFSQLSVTDDNMRNDNLTGIPMNKEDYFHNNMKPFLRGQVTQNTDIERMSNYTDRMTGNDTLYIKKRETQCLFKPEIDEQVCTKGMKNNDEFYKSRVIEPLSKNNEFPIQPIRVAPGLNRGYSSEGVGGFQQFDSSKYGAPPDLQAIKPKTDQTSKTFEIPFQGPKTNNVTKRSMLTNISKHLPDKTFQQTHDNLFVTGGAVTKPTTRPVQNIKNTNATIAHIDYKGHAKDTQLLQSIHNDYGKSNVIVYDNERQTYETKTIVSNLTSLVNAVINPLVDTMKNSIKEYLIDAPRQEGMLYPQIPNAITVHDPTDTARTTIKETTITDSDNLNLKAEDGTYTMLQDYAKTTTKETTIHDSDNLNLKAEDGTYTMIQDHPKTTTKETTIHDSDNLNLKAEDGTYTMIQDDQKTTTKETLIHDSIKLNVKGSDKTYTSLYDKPKITTNQTIAVKDVYRNIGGTIYKTLLYNPDIIAKTTTKQTTLHKTQGFIGGILEGLFGAYLNTNTEAKNTNKQFTHNDYKGGITTNISNQTSHLATDNAEIDGTRENIMIAAGHTPNGGQSSLNKINNGTINMKSNKAIIESEMQRVTHNPDKLYQNTPNSNIYGITKEKNQLNSYTDYLDPSAILSALKDNPFNITINPIN